VKVGGNILNYNSQVDITKTIRIIEGLKSELLTNIAQLYGNMANGRVIEKDENLNVLADMVTIIYLLAWKMGISYEEVDKKLLDKIDLNILKEKDDDWVKQLITLSDYFENGNSR